MDAEYSSTMGSSLGRKKNTIRNTQDFTRTLGNSECASNQDAIEICSPPYIAVGFDLKSTKLDTFHTTMLLGDTEDRLLVDNLTSPAAPVNDC
jgi:hypothetical protein